MSRMLLMSLALAAAPLAAQQFPTAPPPAGPIAAGPLPAYQESTLPNGLRLLVVENHRQPVVSITLSLAAGSVYEPVGREGLADLVASLVPRGAGTRSGEALASAIEAVGGSLSAQADPEFLTIQADVLAPHADIAFDLLADMARRPTFPAAELDLRKRQVLTALQAEQSEPALLGNRALLKTIYGAHPYGSRPTSESISRLSRGDLAAFAGLRFRPGSALLVVTGDLSLAAARQQASRTLGSWTGATPARVLPKSPPVRTARSIVLIHRPEATHSDIMVGNVTVSGSDTSYYAGAVANQILGGGSESRLTRTLRDEHNWTDNATTTLLRTRGPGLFQAVAEVRTEVTDSALRALLDQLRRLRTELVPADELDDAKSALVGSFPFSLQTANQVAVAVTDAKLLGLPANYLQTYRTRLAAVTAARVRTAARSLFRPDAAVIVVVGDGARIYRALAAIAPVTLLGTDGAPLTQKDLTPAPSKLDLDLTQLVARRDSLIVSLQGRAVGFQTAVFEPTGGGFTYTERTIIGNFVSQTTTVAFDSAAAVRSVTQQGTMQGQKTGMELAYSGSGVKGSAQLVGSGGPVSLTIDTALATGILDENAIQALLPAFRWAPAARWNIAVFSAGENRVKSLTLSVLSRGSLALAGGTFDVYQAELRGGEQAVSYFLTADAPHRLLKMTIANTQFEFVAAQ